MVLIAATVLSYPIGLALRQPWLLPLLNALPAYIVLVHRLRKGERGGAVRAMLWWAVALAILGTLAFGREAMGLGDVHLMFGIGAVIGAAGSVIIFFVAPFIGLLFALYKLLFGKGRELPYGPFLSLATAVVLLFYCRIVTHLAPSMEGLRLAIQQTFFGSGI